MTSAKLILSAIAVAAATPAFAGFSAFDVDTEGWSTAYNGGSLVNWNPGGDNGHIQAIDNVAGPMMFNAPSAYLGDQSYTYGGVLSYDFYSTGSSNAGASMLTNIFADVQLVGAGMILEYNVDDPNLNEWTSYEISLTETAGWRVSVDGGNGWLFDDGAPTPTAEQFEAVLSDLTAMRLGTEVVDSLGDMIALDNVRFAPIPAPGAIALLGLAGLTGTRRRRG